LFARSVERFDKPVDVSKKERKQLPWRKPSIVPKLDQD